MTIRAITFDFGNVVAFFDHRLITNRLAPHSALPADQIHAALFGCALEHDYDAGRISTAAFLQQVRDRCQVNRTDGELAADCADIFWSNEEVIALLPLLKPRYRLLLGSNTNELHSAQFTRQFADALRYFDHVVLSHHIRTRKPEAAFFEHCQRLAGCPAAECLFIDDLPVNVAAARACGWHGIVYARGDDLRRRLAEFGVAATTD